MHNVVIPTVSDWIGAEPRSAAANFFSALYVAIHEGSIDPREFIRRALTIDPHHQRAISALVWLLIGDVENAQHELPGGYLGSPSEDVSALQQGMSLADHLEDPQIRENLVSQPKELMATANDWIQFMQTDIPQSAQLEPVSR